jgi:hypothetical protein
LNVLEAPTKVIHVYSIAHAGHTRETLQRAPACEFGEVDFEIKGQWSNAPRLSRPRAAMP